jgi:hypothetical protein
LSTIILEQYVLQQERANKEQRNKHSNVQGNALEYVHFFSPFVGRKAHATHGFCVSRKHLPIKGGSFSLNYI